VEHYYRPPGLLRHKQPWLAPVWRKAQSPRASRIADTARNLEVMRRMWNGVIAGAVMICRVSSSLPTRRWRGQGTPSYAALAGSSLRL
jgi:hypothetical protein